MNALQRYEASICRTPGEKEHDARCGPWTAAELAVIERNRQRIAAQRRTPKFWWLRFVWRWLRLVMIVAFLPAAIAWVRAGTIVMNTYGQVMGTFPWPENRTVVIVVPTTIPQPPPHPSTTPAPKPPPGPTPRPA
jgi:hypothetical protein